MKRYHEETAQVLYDLMADGIGHKLSQKIDEKLEPILCKLDSIYQESQNNSEQIEKLKVEIEGIEYLGEDVLNRDQAAEYLRLSKSTIIRYEKRGCFTRLNKVAHTKVYYLKEDIVQFKIGR